MAFPAKKKLLVLDVNGLLLDTYYRNEKRPKRPADGKVNKHFVYRRPYCDKFIEFCFENFEVGIWSSAKQHNVDGFINFVFGDLRSKLLFSWHQADCTDTGLKTPENRCKPVFLKELSKLWNKVNPDLPWEGGDYGPFNTLLIDDSPYKALHNPPYTAVFPYPYKVSNNFDDSLGGALRKYLEGLATASNVQHYVKHHPFGQPPISEQSPNWSFYRKILSTMGDQEASWTPSHQEYKVQSMLLDDREMFLQSGNGQHSNSALHIAKQRKKHGLHLASSTNEYSTPGKEEEENDMVNATIPNMENNISLENREVGLHSGNGQHSESSSCVGKRKKRHRDCLVTSTSQSSIPGMKEENGVVNMAMLNKEKSISLEKREVGLHSGNGQHSESSSCVGKRKKRHRDCLVTSTNQSSVPGMKEENGVVNVAMLNMEKSISLENREVGLHSGNQQHSESSSCFGKRKKRHRDCLVTSINQSSVPGMKEENGVVNAAILNMEKSISLENRKLNLLSGSGQQSESSLSIGKKKKRHRDCPVTSTNQSSVPGMKEENGVVNAAILNMEKSISLENRKLNLPSGSGQQSESSLSIGKRKKRHRDRLLTGTNQSSVLGKEKEENCVAEAGMQDVEKSKSITQESQDHESCSMFRGYKDVKLLSDHGDPPEVGISQNSSFSNRKRKHKFIQDASIYRESISAMGYKEDCLAEALDISMTKGYGTTVASSRREYEVCDMACKNKAVVAQTDKNHCGKKPYTTSGRKFCDHNSFRHVIKSHHHKPAHLIKDSHMNSNRWSSSHSQTNSYRGSQASYIPRRQFQANRGHKNSVNASIQTQVTGGDIYTSNKFYGRNVHTNLPPYQLGGYINNAQDQRHMWGGSQYALPGQSYNPSHIGYTVFQSYNPNQGAIEFQGPVIQNPFPHSVSHEQMHAAHYSTQYQGHGRKIQHWKNSSSSKRFGRR